MVSKNDEKRAKELSAMVAKFGKKPLKKVPSPYNYLAQPKTKIQVVEKPLFYGAPGKDGRDGRDGMKGEKGERGATGNDGKTPVKGVDYFTEADKQELLSAVPLPTPAAEAVKEEKEFVITPEIVKEIVKMMGTLPVNDRLEVQSIRNFQSFLYNGKKYKVEELMHGGGSSAGSSANVVTEYSLIATQVGNDAVVALSQLVHFPTFTNVIAAMRNQIPQTNGVTCTITATNITFLNADAGEVYSVTYAYS